MSDWIRFPDFSHGFLVPIILLYVSWGKRGPLRAAAVDPNNSGPLILLPGLITLILGKAATGYFLL